MLRIIAALSLAAMLGTSTIPAVAQNPAERFFLDEDGELPIVGKAKGLENFFSELEDLKDLFDADLLFIAEGDEEDLVGGVSQGSEQGDVESGDVQPSVGSSTRGSAIQGFEQEDVESGDVSPSVNISNRGDNANLSPAVLQSANSGNIQNAQGVTLFGSNVDDIEFEGSSISIAPELEQGSTQTIEQPAVASK